MPSLSQRLLLVAGAAVVAGAAALAVLPSVAEEPDAAEAAEAVAAPTLPAITVADVASRTLRDRVIASGLVYPVEEVQVAPLVEGQPLEALLADVGDMVSEGQVLATLSKTSLELQRSQQIASLEAAKATIAQAEAQLLDAETSAAEARRVADRTAKLRAQGTSSIAQNDQAQAAAISARARVNVAQQSLEAARAQLTLAEAQLANLDLNLSRTEVRAPVAGRITARNAVLGGIATAAGQPMFVITRDNALELRAEVAEAFLPRVAEGQKVTLRTVGGTETIAGTIRLVDPVVNAQSRLGQVRIAIAGGDALKAGMFMDAEILVTERDALAIPLTAITVVDGQANVMVARDSVIARVPVTTGIRDGGWVEITEGLAAGDLVVAKAGAFVRDGDRINPVPLAMN